MMDLPPLTTEMTLVLSLLALAILIFTTEILRVDVAAVLVMTLLGLLSYLPGMEGLVGAEVLFAGFSSNAVVSIIAVMIIGGGLDKTGVMSRVASALIDLGGRSEKRIVPLVSSTAGVVSSFMQNVGATALFLPVVSRISARTGLPLSRLLMPMGFCAILGGTLTMVGSSPLIMLNDLIASANRTLPPDQRIERLGLFAVAPIGLALLATGLLYFVVFGRAVLPTRRDVSSTRAAGTLDYLKRIYGLDAALHEVEVPVDSPLIGERIMDVQQRYNVRIVATHYAGKTTVSTPPEATLAAPAVLGVIAQPGNLAKFVNAGRLRQRSVVAEFQRALAPTEAGIAELVVPPNSAAIGETVRSMRMRMKYGLTLLSIFRAGDSITENLPDVAFQAGDTLVCHTRWEDLVRLEKGNDFVVVTSEYPHEETRPHKVVPALLFFGLALLLVLATDIALPIALMTGAIGMIVTRVLDMDEAYRAVSWKTVFILAGLLPLGVAMESTGAANWLAQLVLAALGDVPVLALQAAIAVLAAVFSLVMSNVGATVLLVPIALSIAVSVGADTTMFALTVAVSTSNAFIIPTHQVNALIMGPGGYHVSDFVRAGGIMSLLFLVVSLAALNLLF